MDPTNTTVTLILKDDKIEIISNFPKNILMENSEYFRGLLTLGKESTESEITLKVLDAAIAYNLLSSFVEGKWYQLLKNIQMRSYFCMYTDPKELYDLDVPAEAFDRLLEVVSYFDVLGDKNLLRCIKRNLPMEYPLEKMDKKIIKAILDMCPSLFASAAYDKIIHIYDILTGKYLHTLKDRKYIQSMAFANNKSWLAYGGDNCNIQIWDAVTGDLIKTLTGHQESGFCMRFSRNNKWLASCSRKTVILWDMETMQLTHVLGGHTDFVGQLAFSNNNKMLASCSENMINIWDPMEGKLLHTLDISDVNIKCIAFSNDCQYLAAGTLEGKVKLWNFQTNEGTIEEVKNFVYEIPGNCVKCILFSHDDSKIIISDYDFDHNIKILDSATGKTIQIINDGSNNTLSMALSPDNEWLAIGNNDSLVKILDTVTYKPIHKFVDHVSMVLNVAFSGRIYDEKDEKLNMYLTTSVL